MVAAGTALQRHKAGSPWLQLVESSTLFLDSVLSPRWYLFWFLLLTVLS